MTDLLQRLCWNTNSWRGPTGDMFRKEKSYVGKKGFGHEEWNLNTSDLIDGNVYGYSYYSPKDGHKLLKETHNIYFFAIRPDKERVLVGYYTDARFLNSAEKKALKKRFGESEVLSKRIDELVSLGVPPLAKRLSARTDLLDDFAMNIKVAPENVFSFDRPIPLTKEMAGGQEPRFLSRYTRPRFLSKAPDGVKTDSGGAEQEEDEADNVDKRLEDAYVRLTKRQKVIVQRLHNQLSNRFRAWLKEAKVSAISAEAMFVDVTCKLNDRLLLFELKTCFQQSTKHAIREAIGQVLEYSYFPGRTIPNHLAIVLDARPSKREVTWCKTLASHGLPIELFWMQGEKVYCAGVAKHPLNKVASGA